MDAVEVFDGSLAGSRPAPSYFLCLAKESNQRKATLLRHPFGAGLD